MNSKSANLHLPTDERAERSLIATLIAAPKFLYEVLPVIETSDVFVNPAYKLLYETIRDIHQEGKGIKLGTILQRLNASGKTKILLDNHISLVTIEAEARQVDCIDTAHHLRGLWTKRIAVESSSAVIRAVADGETAAQIVDRLTKSAELASHGQSVGADRSMADVLGDTIKAIELARAKGTGLTGVPTGLAKLDNHFGGWQNTDVIMIAGRPGMGKSVSGLCHALSAAHAGIPTAFLSLEMPATSLCNRAYSAETLIPYSNIKRGRLAPHQWQQLGQATQKLTNLPIHFYDDAGRDVNDLSAKMLYWKKKHGIGLVVIDYVQLLTDRTVKGGKEYDVLTSVSMKLKQLQRRMECPVIELAQLNRSVETRGNNRRPMMSDLKSTGQFEQDASVVIMLYREDYYAEQAEREAAEKEGRYYQQPPISHNLEYGIVKNRDGGTGTAMLWCDVSTNRLLDSEPRPTYEQPALNPRLTVTSTEFNS